LIFVVLSRKRGSVKRGFNSSTFGFNGKEMDNEFGGSTGAIYDYGFRIYDSRIAKFLSVDPLTKDYPWYTPYQFAGNKPINSIDLDGLEELVTIYSPMQSKKVDALIQNLTDENIKEIVRIMDYGLTHEFVNKGEPSSWMPDLVAKKFGVQLGRFSITREPMLPKNNSIVVYGVFLDENKDPYKKRLGTIYFKEESAIKKSLRDKLIDFDRTRGTDQFDYGPGGDGVPWGKYSEEIKRNYKFRNRKLKEENKENWNEDTEQGDTVKGYHVINTEGGYEKTVDIVVGDKSPRGGNYIKEIPGTEHKIK
jgi:RHS repeat-associated protein